MPELVLPLLRTLMLAPLWLWPWLEKDVFTLAVRWEWDAVAETNVLVESAGDLVLLSASSSSPSSSSSGPLFSIEGLGKNSRPSPKFALPFLPALAFKVSSSQPDLGVPSSMVFGVSLLKLRELTEPAPVATTAAAGLSVVVLILLSVEVLPIQETEFIRQHSDIATQDIKRQ